ncbi:nucleotidyltransferase family protein [Flavipsychrobacter stenotrophus]|nr:hypothetical protein [Flavipsychrobacter stenotrophus]
MPSKKYQSSIESNSAFMMKMEELVKEIIIQNNVPYYRIESRMDHQHSSSGENIYIPVIRVITYFEDSVSKISEIVGSEFDVMNERSKDKKKIKLDSFSYKHIQLTAGLKPARQELIEYRRSGTKKFEIHVCSMLQDAWAGIEKELGYDNATFPEEMKRDFYRVGALLEMADLEFLKIRSQLNAKYNWVEQAAYEQNEEVAAIAPQPAPVRQSAPVPQPVVNEIPLPAAQYAPQVVAQPQPVAQPAPQPVAAAPVNEYIPQQQAAPVNGMQGPFDLTLPTPAPQPIPAPPPVPVAPVVAQVMPVVEKYVAPVVIPTQPIQQYVAPAIEEILPVINTATQPHEIAQPVLPQIVENKIEEVVNHVSHVPVIEQVHQVEDEIPALSAETVNVAANTVNVATNNTYINGVGNGTQANINSEEVPFYEREPEPIKAAVMDENSQMTDATLKQYVAASKLIKEVDSEIARRAGATLNNEVDVEGDVERLKYLKVYSLKQLHERVVDNKNDIILFAEKWIGKDNGGSFDSGICLFYLEYLLVGKKNDPAFAVEYVLKFISDNDYSARFIIPTYNSISKNEKPIASHLTLK